MPIATSLSGASRARRLSGRVHERAGRRTMRGILDAVSPAATLVEALEPLRSDPARAAVLLDIDGTLAPIVRHAADAHVPEATRTLLIEIAKRYARRRLRQRPPRAPPRARSSRSARSPTSATTAASCCARARPRPRSTPSSPPGRARVRAFAARVYTAELQRLRVRREDKDAIAAFHWRGAPDEDAAAAARARDRRARAEAEGFAVHWGRKVLEVRPPVDARQGPRHRRAAARHRRSHAALYVGDDTTDLDAFRGLRALVAGGRAASARCAWRRAPTRRRPSSRARPT